MVNCYLSVEGKLTRGTLLYFGTFKDEYFHLVNFNGLTQLKKAVDGYISRILPIGA
jgi:hypothetical protein